MATYARNSVPDSKGDAFRSVPSLERSWRPALEILYQTLGETLSEAHLHSSGHGDQRSKCCTKLYGRRFLKRTYTGAVMLANGSQSGGPNLAIWRGTIWELNLFPIWQRENKFNLINLETALKIPKYTSAAIWH